MGWGGEREEGGCAVVLGTRGREQRAPSRCERALCFCANLCRTKWSRCIIIASSNHSHRSSKHPRFIRSARSPSPRPWLEQWQCSRAAEP
jgi:hypothetical protein